MGICRSDSVQNLSNKGCFVPGICFIQVIVNSWVIRLATVCCASKCVSTLTHAKLPVFVLAFLVWVSCGIFRLFFLRAGRCVSHSAERGGLVQGGCGDSSGEEIQQRAVWRYYDLAYIRSRCAFLSMTLGSVRGKRKIFISMCSWFSGLIGSLFSLLQFLGSPITGALSDQYGRRPLLILTTVSKISKFCCVWTLFDINDCTGNSAGMPSVPVCSGLIEDFMFQLGLMSSYAVWVVSRSFSMFLLFRVIGGICKGNVSLCTAIVADLPCPKVRNRGMVGADLFWPVTRILKNARIS